MLTLPRRIDTSEFEECWQNVGTTRLSNCGPLQVHGMTLMFLRRIHTKEYEEFSQTVGTARVSDCGPSLLPGATCDDGWRALSSVVETNCGEPVEALRLAESLLKWTSA